MDISNIDLILKEIVKQYYNMTEPQREYITSLVEDDDIEWTRIELMKSLLFFNKCIEYGYLPGDIEMNDCYNFIDNNSKIISNILTNYDIEYRKEHGVN